MTFHRSFQTLKLRRSLFFAAFALALPTLAAAGQVRGRVVDPDGTPLPGATASLTNDLVGYSQLTTTGDDGTFRLFNVPDNPYHLIVTLDGFRAIHLDLEVRGNVPLDEAVTLQPGFSDTTTVIAEKEAVALETDTAASHIDIDKSLIQRFPAAVASRAFEAIVLSAPGFSQDENGRFHFQGGHSQQLLVIDGQPIGDQLGVTFSNSLDPAIAEDLEIIVGGIAAEYGEKANGVINLTTRSSLGKPGWRGDVGVGASSFATAEAGANLGWGSARQGLFTSLDGSQSDRFLDPVSFDNHHNHGDTGRGFLRYDVLSAGGADSFRLTANLGRTDRDVTNLPSQEEAGQRQRVRSADWNLNLGFQHVSGDGIVVEAQAYGRDNRLQLFGSAGDTPVTAVQDRSLQNQGLNASVAKAVGVHQFKAGVQAKRFPIRESFSFGVTDPGFNDPDSPGYNPNLAPFDLTRDGTSFRVQRRQGRHVRGALRPGHDPVAQPDRERRAALRPQSAFRDGDPAPTAGRPRLLHPRHPHGRARLLRPDVHHARVREHLACRRRRRLLRSCRPTSSSRTSSASAG